MLSPNTLSSSTILLKLKDEINKPILASLMESRLTCWLIVGAAATHSGLTALGLPGWSCPFWHVLGIPCPGCGLSRAIVALLHGDWYTALTLHAFAPFFLLALSLIACSVLLPQRSGLWLVQRVEIMEQRTGITAILLIGLVLYWLVRLLVFPVTFINLIQG